MLLFLKSSNSEIALIYVTFLYFTLAYSYISFFSGYTNSIKNSGGSSMNVTDKHKRIRTAPKGAWESGEINEDKGTSQKQHLNDITTDSQGNGYPVTGKNRDD